MAVQTHRKSLVILGNGMATGRLLDELLAGPQDRWDITVIGEEAQGSYNRILLPGLLAGELQPEALIQKPPRWYREHGINLITARATRIDRRRRRVSCGNIQVLYDHLVIATGSRPAALPAAHTDLPGIFSFRDLRDAEGIEARARSLRDGRALVIGGGLLGLEAAWGLRRQGLHVTVIHRNERLMNRQLDRTAAGLLADSLREKGIDILLDAEVEAFVPDAQWQLKGARLRDGRLLSAGLAIIATGIKPNAEIGLRAGLHGERGIAVDDLLGSSDPCISALGECVEHAGRTFGLVDPIWEQCRTLAARLRGEDARPFQPRPVPTRLKVSGIQLFSMGEFSDAPGVRAVELRDERKRVYRKIFLRGDTVCGAVLFGDVRGGLDYYALMESSHGCGQGLPDLLLQPDAIRANGERRSA